MDEVLKIILDWLKAQNIGTVLILFALLWVYRKSKQDGEMHVLAMKGALDNTETARQERWKDMSEALTNFRERVDECEKDRRRLWQGMFKLGLKVKPDDDNEQ